MFGWKKKALEPDVPQEPAAAPTGDTTPLPNSETSRLSQLRRQLYARDESETLKSRDEDLHRLGIRRTMVPAEGASLEQQPVLYQKLASLRAKRHRRWLLFGGGSVLIILLFGGAVAGTLWYRIRHNVTPEQIALTLEAPTEIAAGDTVTYRVKLRNESFVDWQNLEVTFEPPSGFRYSSSSLPLERSGKQYTGRVERLASQEEFMVEIMGQVLGEQNATLTAGAELVFTPENFPSGRFTRATLASTTIASVPVEVSIDATAESESGQRIIMTVQIRNTSSNPLAAAYLKLNPSPGVQLAVEDSEFSPAFSVIDSSWDLGTLPPLSDTSRRVIAFVEGQGGERREIALEVGVQEGQEKIIQRELSHVITLTTSALAIEQLYNDASSTLTVTPGQKVSGLLKYSNIGTTGLKNAVVKVAFEGAGLDPSSFVLKQGAYDPRDRTITWTAASVPELATIQPQQEGTLPFEFLILPVESFPREGEAIKNHTLVATATIDSPDLITATGEKRNLVSDRTVLSIGTALTLDATAFYDDGRLGITSSGPLPPKAGEQTTYTVRFRIGSALNDVGEVRLRAVLPDGVTYTGKNYITVGAIDFNDRTGEIVWTIPQLAGGTGRVRPSEELHVQVAIVPGEHQQGEKISFLNHLKLEGTDLFTEFSVQQELTVFPDTDTAASGKGKVQ